MNKKLFVIFSLMFIFTIFLPFGLTGCNNKSIKLYDIENKKIVELDFEDYVAGVTAAEIDESFSTEAIKTQSVLARTFAVHFLKNSKSKYDGADISNDITEAQAYTSKIPDKIRDATKSTKGKVLTYDGQIFRPYFCSNCGGKNSLAKDVFGVDAPYSSVVDTLETSDNSKNFEWSANIEKSAILFAAEKLNISLASANSFEVFESDQSGRAKTFKIGGKVVNANAFRVAVGSTILKSCLITNITVKENSVTFSGRGYGHGVGLSQWGANILASQNNSYEQILKYYFKDCLIENL